MPPSNDFLFNNIKALARSLAAYDCEFEKVIRIIELCPSLSFKDRRCEITKQSLQAFISLSIYFLDSNLRFKEEILQYVLCLLKLLPWATWSSDYFKYKKNRIPLAEEFSFCLGSLLNEIYIRDEVSRKDVFTSLHETLIKLNDICYNIKNDYQNGIPVNDSLIIIVVPLLIGFLKSFGQPTFLPEVGGPNVFSEIFPSSFPYSTTINYSIIKVPTNGSIMPLRDMFKDHLKYKNDKPSTMMKYNPNPQMYSVPLYANISPFNGNDERNKKIFEARSINYYAKTEGTIYPNTTQQFNGPQFKDAPADVKYAHRTEENVLNPQNFFFHSMHGTFSEYVARLYPNKLEKLVKPIFDADQVMILLQYAKKLLDKDLLSILDAVTINFNNRAHFTFFYPTYKEIINYTGLSFLHNVLQNYPNPSLSVTDEVHKFVQALFVAEQTELYNYTHHDVGGIASGLRSGTATGNHLDPNPSKRRENEAGIHQTPVSSERGESGKTKETGPTHRKFELCVKSNALCIEILIWAVTREETIEAFTTKLTERLSVSHSLRIIVAHMPLLVVCLKALGTLAEKDTYLAQSVIIPALLDFLMKPTSPLAKLYKEQEIDIKKRLNFSTYQNTAYYTITSISKMRPKFDKQIYQSSNFETLCETALENICKALRTIYSRDHDCVQALLASISGRIYYAESLSNETTMVSHNTILSLGELATQLRDIPHVMESVLTIFLQRFGHPPSDFLDILIIRQLGNMLFAASLGTNDLQTDEKIYKEVMNLFIVVILKSSHYNQQQNGSKDEYEVNELNYKRASLEILKTLCMVVSNFGSFPICKVPPSTRTNVQILLDWEPKDSESPKFSNNSDVNPINTAPYDSWQMDMLVRILELFVQMGLENQKLSDNFVTGSLNIKALNSAENLGLLIPLVSTIMQNIPFVHSPKPRLHKLFRDFWLYCVLLGFAQEKSVWPPEWFRCISVIATKSPLLIFKEHLRSDLHYNTALKADKLGQNELAYLKNTLLCILNNKPEVVSCVKQMTFGHLSYLLSIYQLETLRVKNSEDVNAVHYMFHYLEDKSIQKDKSGMWECVCSIAEIVFNEFLSVMVQKPKNKETNAELERHAQFLLVKFNHNVKRIRKVADYCLAKLVDNFPHLLWDRIVLKTMLDLLHLLCKSLYLSPEENIEEYYIVPETTYKIKFMDDMDGKEKILQDFTDRCSSIIQEGLRWAPIATKSCLKKYINDTSSVISFEGNAFDYHQHAGLSLALETIIKYSGLNANVSQLMGNQYDRWPACVKYDTSNFLSEINLQIRFQGEIEGLKAAYREKGLGESQLSENLSQKLNEASNNFISQETYRDCYLKATAMIIFSTELDENLLHQVAWANLKKFTLASMETAVECWEWLLTSRPDLELKFFREMFTAWDYSMQNRMGIFEGHAERKVSALAVPESCNLKPTPLNVAPHLVWIKFIYQRTEVAKYGSTDLTKLFVAFLHSTLTPEVGKRPRPSPTLTRHISGVNCRFRLLINAFSLLQLEPPPAATDVTRTTGFTPTGFAEGPAPIASIAPGAGPAFESQKTSRVCYVTAAPRASAADLDQLILRGRVYATAFDYFCTVPQYPLQSNFHLKDDALVLLKFWQNLVLEKKYLKNVSQPFPDEVENGMPRNWSMNKDYKSDINYSQYQHGSWISVLPGSTQINKPQPGKNKCIKDVTVPQDSELTRDFMKKRNLLLTLLANEIERICTWLNPLGNSSKILPNEDTIVSWKSQAISDKTWREMARLAWNISPVLAVYLPLRFKNSKALFDEVSKLVLACPQSVSHIPEAITLLVTPQRVENDAKELSAILTWATTSPTIALSFLCNRIYPYHPLIVQYGIRVLQTYPPEVLIFYIPQIVQAVRYDSIGYVSQFLIAISQKSQLLAHQLLWNMKTNQYMDEDGKVVDEALFEKLDYIVFHIVKNLSGPAKAFYLREFDFFNQITNVSAIIRPFPKGKERKQACLEALRKIKTKPGCYLPSNPEAYIIDIDYNSAIPMQSAAKAPYLARFKVQRCGIKELEKLAVEYRPDPESDPEPEGSEPAPSIKISVSGTGRRRNSISSSLSETQISSTSTGKGLYRRSSLAPLLPSSSAFPVYWQAAIFKVGDDVRQDMLALQIIALFKNVAALADLDLYLYPYHVVATAPGCGVIECVPDSKSRDQLGRQTDIGLYEYFLKKYGDESTTSFQKARQNFIKSMAAYSVMLFLLQIKDRHNGNIMIDNLGHIIHIDFGFLFESSPGGNLGFEPDIKLTDEMVMIMGGKMEAHGFQWFMELCVKGFLAFRPYEEAIVTLVSLMLDTRFPCFRGQTIKLLRSRFASTLSEKEAAQFMIAVIHRSYLNYRTRAYDLLQYYQNQIPY